MSHTLQTVMKQLGDAAQLVGGRIVVFKDGKHIDVGGLSMSDSVFSLTEAGKALLEQPAEKPKAESKKAAKESIKVPADDKFLDDLNLDEVA